MSDVNINIRLVTAAAEANAKKLAGALGNTEKRAKGLGSSLGNVATIARGVFLGNVLQTALFGIAQGVTTTVFAFAKFEEQLIAVGKTTGIAGSELSKLGDEFLKLSTEIPVASEELLSIGTIAGQLGIKGSKDIIKFTDTVARLGVSVEGASTEEFAKQLARIAQLTGTPIAEIDKLASALVGLGNNVAANEAEIATIALRLSSTTKQFNLSAEAILGLSATFAEIGISAELGGSATLRILRSITDAASTGGAALDKYVEITGLTVEQFKDLAKNSPQDAIVALSKGLNQLGKKDAVLVTEALKVLNLNELRAATAVNGLSGAYERLNTNLRRSSDDFGENIQLTQESGRVFEGTTRQLQLAKNEFSQAATILSETLTPALTALIKAGTSSAKVFTGIAKIIREAYSEDASEPINELANRLNFVNANLQLVEDAYINGAISLKQYNEQTEKLKEESFNLENAIGLTSGKLSEADVEFRKAKKSANEYRLQIEDLKKQLSETDPSNEFSRNILTNQIKLNQERLANEEKFIRAFKELRSNGGEAGGEDPEISAEIKKFNTLKEIREQNRAEEQFLREEEKLAVDLDNQENLVKLAKFYADRALIENKDRIDSLKGEAQKEAAREKIVTDARNRALKTKEKQNQAELKGERQFRSNLSTLAASGSKEAFRIQQAVAINDAILNAESAKLGAIAFGTKLGGPALGAIFGVISTAATAGIVANIASQKPPSFQDGGIVPGNSINGDRVTARVNSGEMILNRQQQAQLFQQANGQGGTGQNMPTEVVVNNVVELDGDVVFKSVSRQVADGKILGENQ